jgi:hypothetical protein
MVYPKSTFHSQLPLFPVMFTSYKLLTLHGQTDAKINTNKIYLSEVKDLRKMCLFVPFGVCPEYFQGVVQN